MVKRKLNIRISRNAAIAMLLIALLLAPSFAHAAFSPAGIFTGAAGAGVGCAIGAIITIWVLGAGCLIGGLAGGVLGLFTGLFNFSDPMGKALVQFAVFITRLIAGFVVGLLLPYAAELLRAGVILNIQSITDFPPVQQATALSSNLANLILVAVFIIIGLATILGMESYGMRKNLPLFIMIVLIVNFSTVFVDLAANTGNVFMRFFWENSSLKNTPLSALILGNMHISSIVSQMASSDVEKQLASGSLKGTEQTSAASARAGLDLLIIFLGLFATYVIFRLGLVFILRIGILWLLTIIAPLVFAVSVLPPMRKHLQEWWKQLLNWAFIGPATFFFFFFGLLIWVELNKAFIQGGLNATSGASPNTLAGFAPFYMFPLVMIFFMVAVKMSKQMAGAAANGIIDGAMKIGKGVALGTLALGAGAALSGAGVGLGKISRSVWVKNAGERMQRSRVGGIQALGRGVTKLRNAEVEKEQGRIKRSQGVWDDFVEDNDPSIVKTAYDRGDARTRVSIIKGKLKHGKALDEKEQADAIKYGSWKDPDLRREVRRLYLGYDKSIYENEDPTQDLSYAGLQRKFKATTSRHQINFDGITDESKKLQAFFVLMANHFGHSDWNNLIADPDPKRLTEVNALIGKLGNSIEKDPAFVGKLKDLGYDDESIKKRMTAILNIRNTAFARRSGSARASESTA